MEATVAHPTLRNNSHALRIHGTIVYLPTRMVDFFGKCTLPETNIVAENMPGMPKVSLIIVQSPAVNSLLASWRVSPNIPVPWILWKLLVDENVPGMEVYYHLPYPVAAKVPSFVSIVKRFHDMPRQSGFHPVNGCKFVWCFFWVDFCSFT